jgi:hypothetical protein
MGTTRVSEHDGPTAYLARRLTGLSETKHPERHWTPAPVAPIDFRDPDRLVPLSVVGTHGGAGTSTVARLLTAADLGRHWPDPGDGSPPRVLLVARTHAAGLMAASQALAGYCAKRHPEGIYLVGSVLVADAPGRLPKLLAQRITILGSATMVYRLPWVHIWRLNEITPDPRLAGRLAAGLRRFVEQAALTGTPALHAQIGGLTCEPS